MDIHIPPNQHDVIVFAGQGAALIDMAENPGEDLGHLGAGDVVFGTKIAIGIPCDKLPLHHRADIIVGPRTDLVGIRELGQVLIRCRHQAESTGNHNDCLLPGDVIIRLHQPVAVSGQGSHVDGLRDVVVVPAPSHNVRVVGYVRILVSAVEPVHHGGHLSTSQQPMRFFGFCNYAQPPFLTLYFISSSPRSKNYSLVESTRHDCSAKYYTIYHYISQF